MSAEEALGDVAAEGVLEEPDEPELPLLLPEEESSELLRGVLRPSLKRYDCDATADIIL